MPNGTPQEPPKKDKQSLLSYYAERARIALTNRVAKQFPWLQGKRQPQISKEGKKEPSDILRELEGEIALNAALLDQLSEIEADWKKLDALIWDEKDQNSLINLYKKSSIWVGAPYFDTASKNNIFPAETEARIMRDGTNVKEKVLQINLGTPQSPSYIYFTTFDLGQLPLLYIEADGTMITEDVSVLGYNFVRNLIPAWEIYYAKWYTRVQANIAYHDVLEVMRGLNTQMSSYLKSINEKETNLHTEWLSPVIPISQKIPGNKANLDIWRPKNVRFRHTYKIIAPAIRNPQYDPNNIICHTEINPPNPQYGPNNIICQRLLPNGQPNPQYDPTNIICQQTLPPVPNPNYDPNNIVCKPILKFSEEIARTNPNFKRADEVEAGLDENGYPLEVYFDEQTRQWKVLLDKWWFEIASNPWQKSIITNVGKFEYPPQPRSPTTPYGVYEGKGDKGGLQVWQAKVVNGVGDPPRAQNIRVVPEKFVQDLDILDMAVFIYNEIDAYRDDLRDKRYHKYSKTTTDYIMAAEGIVTTDHTKFGSLPYQRTYTSHIPTKEIPFSFQPMKDYVTVTPSDFLNVPDDEKQVTRDYEMKLNVPPYIEKGVREPTHLNPAFDRRALKARSYLTQWDFFLHWGRMYYYESTEGINKWSENPFPAISTRGLAKWIIYRILHDLPWDVAKEVAKNDKGYDYGIRRPLLGGAFIKDPLGATDLVSKEDPFG